MADQEEPRKSTSRANNAPPHRQIGLGAAMQALDKPEKTPFEQFKDMQQRLRNMSNEDFDMIYEANKAGIEKIRVQQGERGTLNKYASIQVSGAQRTLNNLKDGGADKAKKLLERLNLCLLIEQHYQRSPGALPLTQSSSVRDLSPPKAHAPTERLGSLNLKSVISSFDKSIAQGMQARNPPPHPAGNLPIPSKSFYDNITDMDALFGGPPREVICQKILIPSSLSLPAIPPPPRQCSLDIQTIKDRNPASAQAAQAALARAQPPSCQKGSNQGRPTSLGQGLFSELKHRPTNEANRQYPNAQSVSDGVHGRIERPQTAPASGSRPGGRERRAQPVVKAPVEGSNRDQAIAIESSDEEEEGKERGKKAFDHQYNKRRSSETILPNTISIDDGDMTDAKRYEGYRCVFPPILPEKKLEHEVHIHSFHPGGAQEGARVSSHAEASTSAPASCAAIEPKTKKKKEKRRVVEVVAKDFERLEPLEFLNDTCIDFYLRFIEEQLPLEMKERCYFFNSFFYKKLAEKVVKGKGKQSLAVTSAGGRVDHCDLDFLEEEDDTHLSSNQRVKHAEQKHKVNHERVRNWTKGVDLFSKDYIFVPIHAGLHWSLVIICHPGGIRSGQSPVVMHLDSMSNGHPSVSIFTHLRYYLHNEWQRKMADDPTSVPATFKPKEWESMNFLGTKNGGQGGRKCMELVDQRLKFIPQQDNHCDCGLFVLSFIEFFCHAQPKSINAKAVSLLNHIKVKDRADALKTLQKGLGNPKHLAFLSQDWIDQRNTGRLRDYIKYLMLGLMHDQAMEALRADEVKEHEKKKREAEKAHAEAVAQSVEGKGGPEESKMDLDAPLGGKGGFTFPPPVPREPPPAIHKMKSAVDAFNRLPLHSRYLCPEEYMEQKSLLDPLELGIQASRRESQPSRRMTKSKTVISSDEEDEKTKQKRNVQGQARKRSNVLMSDEEDELETKQKKATIASLDKKAPPQNQWCDLLSDENPPEELASPPAAKDKADPQDFVPGSPPIGNDEDPPKRLRGRKRKSDDKCRSNKTVNPDDMSDEDFVAVPVVKISGRASHADEENDHDDELQVMAIKERKIDERANYSTRQKKPLPPDDGDGATCEDEEMREGEKVSELLAPTQQEAEEEKEERESKRPRREETRDAHGKMDLLSMQSVLHGQGPQLEDCLFNEMADRYDSEIKKAKETMHRKQRSASEDSEDNVMDQVHASKPLPPLPHPVPRFLNDLHNTTEGFQGNRGRPQGKQSAADDKNQPSREQCIIEDDEEEEESEVQEVLGPKDSRSKRLHGHDLAEKNGSRGLNSAKVAGKGQNAQSRPNSGRQGGRGKNGKGSDQPDVGQRRLEECGWTQDHNKGTMGAAAGGRGGAGKEADDEIEESPEF